jgi:hypothetical protein
MVNFVYGDQTYKQRGKSRRVERLEYIGGDGLPLNIEREVVFNSIHLPVPAALLPQLDQQAVLQIYQQGVYCGAPFMTLLTHLHSGAVQISLLGRLGSCMAFDRLVEYINLRQSQRNSSFRAFDSALHYTQHLLPMLHVDAAYTAAVSGGEAGGDAGYDPRLIREVQRLVELFERKLGRDLTIPSADNPWWHTGNAVRLDAGAAHDYRPWEHVWNVESGQSAGDGLAAQACALWLQDLLASHMFTQ